MVVICHAEETKNSGYKDTSGWWSSPAVTWTTAVMLGLSIGTVTTPLGTRGGTSSVAHFVNISNLDTFLNFWYKCIVTLYFTLWHGV